MDLSLPAGELALLVGALLAAGCVTGLLAGLLGIGDGGILVPVPYEVFSAARRRPLPGQPELLSPS